MVVIQFKIQIEVLYMSNYKLSRWVFYIFPENVVFYFHHRLYFILPINVFIIYNIFYNIFDPH